MCSSNIFKVNTLITYIVFFLFDYFYSKYSICSMASVTHESQTLHVYVDLLIQLGVIPNNSTAATSES